MYFQKLTLDSIKSVEPFFHYAQGRTCDYSVGGMFMWRDYFKMEYFIEDNICYTKLHNENNESYYNLPLCDDIKKAVLKLLVEDTSDSIKFCTIPEVYLELFRELDRKVTFKEQNIYFDYLYSYEDLRLLHGKRYHGQKNLINKFLNDNVDWSYEAINEDNILEVIDFFQNRYATLSDENNSPFGIEENIKTFEVISNIGKYNFIGGVLRIKGLVVGFSLGEIVNDTLFVHIEKADRTIKGAYQMLTHQFILQFENKNVTYVNREEDMGDMGLRTAKEAYHPIKLLKKYIVEVSNV